MERQVMTGLYNCDSCLLLPQTYLHQSMAKKALEQTKSSTCCS